MYRRERKSADSDDSDDEKLPVCDEDEPKAKKSNRNVWSDVLLEESLEKRSARMGISGRNDVGSCIPRGVETYTIPKEALNDFQKVKEDEKPPMITVTPASDNPFGDSSDVDLASVEQFGIAPSSRGFNRGRGRRAWLRGIKRPFNRNQLPDEKSADCKPSPSGTATTTAGTNFGNYGGRGRGNFRGRIGFSNANRGMSLKRNWKGESAVDKYIAPEYSLETLMATEFADGLLLPQLAKEIASALGEKDPKTIINIVEEVGAEKALELFEETRSVESNGGMKIMNGSRRRTPGGVFICLFKSDTDISVEIKDKIANASRQEGKKIYRAKRRGDFSARLQAAKEVLDNAKRKEEDIASSEMKELPEAVDVMLPSTSSEITNGDDSGMHEAEMLDYGENAMDA